MRFIEAVQPTIPACTHPALEVPTGSARGSVTSHNWLLFGWSRNGFRFDGDPAGEHGLVYRTVAFNNNMGFRVKGNYHWFLHNTALGHGARKTDVSFAKNKWYTTPLGTSRRAWKALALERQGATQSLPTFVHTLLRTG